MSETTRIIRSGLPGVAGPDGDPGDTGWTPVLAAVADSARRVLQVTDWTGGTGTKPATGSYVGASGLTGVLASAVDIRGAAGAAGSNGSNGSAGTSGTNGWAPVLAVVTDSARRVLQVSDWAGGTGSKPATGSYVGATGLTAVLVDAIDIRGSAGANGSAGSAGTNGADGVSGPGLFAYTVAGVVAVATGTTRIYNDTGRTLTISKVRASVGTAPTGASLIVDVNKNGTTIFTTQSARPTIAAAGVTATGIPAVTTLADGDYLTVDCDQVGSGTPGADLTVQVVAL